MATSTQSKDDHVPRVVVLNRSYWPDAEATGQLLTELCEDLVAKFDVTVVAGQPNQNPERAVFRHRGAEQRKGVTICRVWNSRLAKSFLPGRALNLLSYLLTASWVSLCIRRPDVIVVETDPPLLCLLGELLRRWHRARLVVYLQDIYPDIAVALGKLPDRWFTRCLRRLMFNVYRRAERVVVLSRDMRDLLVRSGVAADRITCLPNWVDTDRVVPCKEANPFRQRHGLNGQFVVMYSGNLGLCQRLDDILAAAEQLRYRNDIVFLLVGDGASKQHLKESTHRLGLANLRFLPYQPKDKLAESLSAADLHLVPLDPRVASCLMPSKLYGILASGTPLVAIAPGHCELAEITRRAGIGLVATPDDPRALVEAIQWCADHRDDLEPMGYAARRLAEDQFDRTRITSQFVAMLMDVCHGNRDATAKTPTEVVPRESSAALPFHQSSSLPTQGHYIPEVAENLSLRRSDV